MTCRKSVSSVLLLLSMLLFVAASSAFGPDLEQMERRFKDLDDEVSLMSKEHPKEFEHDYDSGKIAAKSLLCCFKLGKGCCGYCSSKCSACKDCKWCRLYCGISKGCKDCPGCEHKNNNKAGSCKSYCTDCY